MEKHLIKTAAIALIRSIGEQLSDQCQGGRLKNKSDALVAGCDALLTKLDKITDQEMKKIENLLTEFFNITGWAGKQRDAITIISFCLALEERSEFDYPDNITKTMNEIFEYRERAGNVKDACLWAGNLACDKWLGLVNSTNNNTGLTMEA